MSFSSLAIKISIAVRGAVIPAVLAAIAYNPDGAITSAVQDGIKMLFLIVPITFLILSIVPLLAYKIKDSDVTMMEKELQERSKTI